MKKTYIQLELWMKKRIRSFVFFLFLVTFYILVSRLPYVNILLISSDFFAFFLAFCALVVFRPINSVTVILGICILLISFVMNLLGYASNADVLGIILYVMIAYLFVISIFRK